MNNKEPITIVFDPEGSDKYPCTGEVEQLLGGVGRVVYDDGTEQFLDDYGEPEYIYSPRLTPEKLERFCEENIHHYQDFHTNNMRKIIRGERVPMPSFWLDQPPPGVLPIIDGPWLGVRMSHAFMTFEADGEDIGCPLTSGQPGNGRVRYFCQQDGDGNWVWSVNRPSNAELLMQAEFAESKRIEGSQ